MNHHKRRIAPQLHRRSDELRTRLRRRQMIFEVCENRILLDNGLRNTALSLAQRQSLLDGLDDIAAWTSQLAQSNQLSQPLAVTNLSIGQSAALAGSLGNGLVNPLKFGSVSATTDEFVNAIKGLTNPSLGVVVNPTTVSGGLLTTALGNELQFSLAFESSHTSSASLNLGSQVANTGLSLNPSAIVSQTSSTHFTFTFGLDLTPGLSADEAFFIRPQAMSLETSIDTSSLTTSAKIGLLESQVSNGTLQLNAAISVGFTNPDADSKGNITVDELNKNHVSIVAQQSIVANSFSGTLPLTATLGAQALNASTLGTTAVLGLTSLNVFAGPEVIQGLGNSSFQELQQFNHITEAGLLTALDRAARGLQELTPSMDVNQTLGGFNYTDLQASDIVNINATIAKVSRTLYDPLVVSSRVASLGSGYALSNDAVFSIRINDTETFPVTIVRTNQFFQENTYAFFNRSLPEGLRNRVVASSSIVPGVGAYSTLRAIDPTISKLEILFSDSNNSVSQTFGFDPGQFSLPDFRFNSIQTFATQLAEQTNLVGIGIDPQYNPVKHELSFRLKPPSQPISKEVPLDFSAGLGPLTYLKPSTATFTVTPTVDGRLGIKLDRLQTVLTATGDAPASGQLSSTARMVVELNGAAGVNITINRDTSNTNIDDLVLDINAAINLSSLRGKVTAGRLGSKITLTSATDSSLVVEANQADTAATQLFLVGSGQGAQWSEQVSLAAGTTVQLVSHIGTTNLNGSATLGILPVTLAGGTLAIDANGQATLVRPLPVGSLEDPSVDDVTLSPVTSSLTGSFIPSVDATLGVSPSNPATFAIGLTTPNQWSTRLIASADAPLNGRLSHEAVLTIQLGSGTPVEVKIPVDNSNQDVDDLIEDVRAALATTRLGSNVLVQRQGNRLVLATFGVFGLSVASEATNSASTELHFNTASVESAITYTANAVFNEKLAAIQSFRTENFISGVQGILDLLEQGRLNHLTSDIPLINQSLDDVLGVSQKLDGAINTLKGKIGLDLKLAVQGIVENLNQAIVGLPTTITQADKQDISDVLEQLRIAARNAERNDVPLPVNLASVVLASIAPYLTAIEKVRKPGVDMFPFNAVASQLLAVTPSLSQLAASFSAALGAGTTTSQFANAKPTGFEQSLLVRTNWAPTTTRSMTLQSIKLPNGLGPLKFNAGSTINLNTTGDFKFDFGFNFTTGTPFLLDTSRFNASASFSAVNSSYSATIGGVNVTLGSVAAPVLLPLQTNSSNYPGSNSVVVNPTSHIADIGNIAFADVPARLNYLGVVGGLGATLPVFVTGNNVGNVTLNWNFPGASTPTSPVVTAPASLTPALESLPYNFALLTEGIDQWNDQLKKLLREEILAKFPLVADNVDIDAGFISRLENQFLSAVQSAITAAGGVDSSQFRTALYDSVLAALGPILVANPIVTQEGAPEMRFRIAGHEIYHSGLDVGLPGLRFETFEPGDVEIALNYDMRLGFGISKTEGFYFIIDRAPGDPNGPQFTLNVGATLSSASEIKAKIFDLPVIAKTNPITGPSATRVAPTEILVKITDSDNHLTIDQVEAALFADEFQIRFGPNGADAHLDLHLVANSRDGVRGDPDLPGIVTDLIVDQHFDGQSTLDEPGAIPRVRLANIGLSLGSAVGKIVNPIVAKVNEFLGPVKPVIAALDAEVPVLSALSKKAGKGRLTWIDAIAKYSKDPDIQELVDAMHKVVDIVKDLQSLAKKATDLANAATEKASVIFGDFDFAITFDLRLPHPNGINPLVAGTFVPRPEFTPTHDGTVSPYVRNSEPNQNIGNFLADELHNDGFRFPIFEDPNLIIPLLFGQDVTIVTWQMKPFKAKFKTPDIFIGVVPVGPVPVTLNAGLSFNIGVNIGVGFDTRGFQKDHDFADGFFFKDEGRGKPAVVSFGAGVFVNASAGIPLVATVGIEGQLNANLTARWHNTDHDDKLHFDELLDNLAQGPACVMDLGGQITTQLSFYINALTYTTTIPIIPTITLFDFSIFSCSPLPPPELAHVSQPATNPEPDFESNVIGPGTLILNVGAFAAQRNEGQSTDGDERMQIFQYDPGIITVTGYGQTKVYGSTSSPITAIYADAASGNNTILVDESVNLPTTLVGGPGNDKLRGGSGRNRIYGKGGKDVLTGGIDDDIIEAGIGEAKLYGGPGNDRLSAEGGVNYLDGEDGVDFVRGGNGPDAIYGGRGNDELRGGGGADHIFGEQDDDLIVGEGIGGVYIEGGRGNNRITGSDGRDTIYAVRPNALPGEAGHNIIFALGENDVIYGGVDNTNEIHAGAGNDTVYGGDVEDLIHAGSGKDYVYGKAGKDVIYADSGENYIYGGIGDDTIYGSSGTTTRPVNWPSQTPPGYDGTYAGSGGDFLYGEEGNDTIYGGVGSSGVIDGGPMSDFIYGGTNSQSIFGGDGDDYIWTGDGQQSISGDAGDDILEQRVAASQSLTDTTVGGRGLHSFSLIERVRLVDTSSVGGMTFDVGGYSGPATLVGAPSGNDIVKVVIDADVSLADTNLRTSLGGSFSLERISRADIAGIKLDNTFDVSLWTGTATLRSGSGIDRVLSVNDADFTLTDTSLTRSTGGNFVLSSIQAVTLGGGPGNNQLNASAFSGNAWLYGAEGNDTLRGGSGHDYLDGGLGIDAYFGGDGDDVIDASLGTTTTIQGGNGNDLIYGSNTSDTINADGGHDRVYARGGNDNVTGGPGDDILDGGSGDDTLSGDAGSDVIVGGANNDILYAFNSAAIGDDAKANFLYGDFGSSGNELGTGNDALHGGSGPDQLFGEAGLNSYAGGGTGTVTRDGSATGLLSTTAPDEPLKPLPPNWPPLLPGQLITLPDGITSSGRWTEYNGSASLGGVSRSPGAAVAPSVAVGAAGPFVAWADSRSGTSQIYVALRTIAGWHELANSAKGGGISAPLGIYATNQPAVNPSIILDNLGMPIVAWTQWNGSNHDVFVARYDALGNSGNGAWVALGSSLSGGGVSGSGHADRASIVMTSSGPVVAWLDTTTGVTNVYAKRFENGTWVSLGANAASGTGVTGSATSISEFALTTDGTSVAVAWPQNVGGRMQIYAREYHAGLWRSLGDSSSGNGLSGTTGSASAPNIAYLESRLVAVWQDNTSGHYEIYAAQYDGASWIDAGENSRTDGGISNTRGQATNPKLASGSGQLTLVWQDDRVAAGTGNSTGIYYKRWRAGSFIEELPGDARDQGITGLVGAPGTYSVTMDAAGHPYVAWNDTVSGKSEIYLRGNTFDVGTIHYVNDSDARTEDVVVNSFTTAAGSDINDGLSPSKPKRSLQAILSDTAHPLNPGDVILIDAGRHEGANLFGAAMNGVLILGSTVGVTELQTPLNVTQTNRLTVSGLRLSGGVRIADSNQTSVVRNDIRGAGASVVGGTSTHIIHNTIAANGTAVTMTSNTASPVIASNTIRGGLLGISFTSRSASAATSAVVKDNRITGSSTGIAIQTAAEGRISGNRIASSNVGLFLPQSFSGLITENEITTSTTGVHYAAANLLSANLIHDNTVGVVTTVASTMNGLGFFGQTLPNRIFGNVTGVDLRQATMQQQIVWSNTKGVVGTGSLVATDAEHANFISRNTTGIDIDGPIQFNRIDRNAKGIRPRNKQLIAHNLMTDNALGIEVLAIDDLRIFGNTLLTGLGTNVKISAASKRIELRNNVLWTDDGYNIDVKNDSTTGFFSDYNALIAGPNGKLVYWTKDFTDILDWQQDVYQFDLHSIGTTIVDPRAAEPRFVSRSLGDLRTFEKTAQLRATSPSIDSGDRLADQARGTDFVNLLVNPSFEAGLSAWYVTPSAGIGSVNPTAYDGVQYFKAAENQTTTLEQTVDLVVSGVLPAQIDALAYRANFGARIRSASESSADRGTLTITFLDVNNSVVGMPFVISSGNLSDRWQQIGESTYLPSGTRKIAFRLDAVRQSGQTNDVYLDHAFVSLESRTSGVDLGAYERTFSAVSPHARLRLISPDLYQDWELNKPIDIRWDSFGNSANSPVVIELLRDTATGPVLDRVISTGTPDDGVFSWIAANSGLTFGTHGWRIQVSLGANRTVLDRSSEAFSVPENTNTFFVNDNSNVGNEFSTAVGSNRNTGKLASAPKPYPNNVLRVYSLGANQTLSVDAGSYPLLYPLIVSNIPGGQDDEGFTFRGSVNQTTEFHHANPLTIAPVLELNDADGMTLRNLTLTGGSIGLLVRNDSIELAASYVSALNNSGRGFQIDTASVATNLDHLIADGNAGAGFYANALIANLKDSRFSNNRSYGIQLIDTGSTKVESNKIYNNTGNSIHGVLVSNSVGGTLVFGNADLSLGLGNLVHDNSAAGIVASGQVSVVGNTVYNQLAQTQTGISVFSGATASRNVVHDSYTGIFSSGGEISENRAYNNLEAGLAVAGATRASRNVVYSNSIGVLGLFRYEGTLINNIVYDNTNYGVLLDSANPGYVSSPVIVNNTIYQPSGDAIRLTNTSSNVRVRNNILSVGAGYALNIATDSQVGFQSDYNAFFVTGTGKTALWENIARASQSAWQTTAFQDSNSLSTDPLFVNILGADGQLGYVSPASDGRDDDFHLKSAYGSFHAVSFAPVATLNGLGVPGALTNPANPILDGTTSPLLDRGDENDSHAAEPTPNGSYINIGGYGGTSQASISPAEYVTVIKPVGGEVWPQEQTFPIRWRSQKVIVPEYALQFDGGDDVVAVGNMGAMPMQGTIEFWMNPSSVSNYRNLMTTSWGQGNRGIRYEMNGNNFYAVIGNDGGDFTGFLLAPSVQTNQLVHIALTWNTATNNVMGYRNGVLQFNSTHAKWPTQLNNVVLGVGYDTSRHFQGILDEVRFWSSQRTAAEIQNNMNSQLTGTEPQLTSLYKFNEGLGTVATNSVPGGTNGILGGGVTSARPTWVSTAGTSGTSYTIELMKQGQAAPVYTIASNAGDTGQYLWTIPSSIPPADDYVIRVTRNDAAAASDISDGAISIRTPISVYYVNDGAFEAGDLTTAIGRDVGADGLSPSSPRASISSILNSYPLKPGDTIFVDAGTYNLNTSLVLTAAASGIRIEGYHNAAYPNRSTIIDRGNTSSTVIVLQNADNVTLDHLTIQGGTVGIHANASSDSDGLTISNSIIQLNDQIGVRFESSNDLATIINSTFDGGAGTAKQVNHLWMDGSGYTISNNTFTRARSRAVSNINGNRLLFVDNRLIDNADNLYVSNSSSQAADRGVIRNNIVVGRSSYGAGAGISVSGNMLTVANDVSNTPVGISGDGEIRGNVVHDNGWGIYSGGGGLVVDNRVYHNREYGIVADGASRPIENRVYDNPIGLVTGLYFAGTVANNLFVNNTSVGILISGSNGAKYVNNTVYQTTGDAIKLVDGRTQNIDIRNNILRAESGYLLSVEPVAQRGFKSDYNVLLIPGTGKIAFWENRSFTDKADWFYEVGQDAHSLLADPQFVDIDGADDVLGFSRGTGLAATYYATNDLTGAPFATRVESTIGFNVGGGTPLSGLPADNFSIRWNGYLYVPQAGSYTFYETSDDGMRLYLNGSTTPVIDQWNFVSLAERTYTTTFATAGWVPIRIEHRELTGAASLSFSWSGPGLSKQAINPEYFNPTLIASHGDYGADDNFTLQVGSPAIDAGDPNSLFFREVQPNGGRVDIGAYGNTPQANISAVQTVQVLSPNGLEKLEQGQVVPITFRTNGLMAQESIFHLNGGATSVGGWVNASQFLVSGGTTGYSSGPVSTAGVANAAPPEVYQSQLYGSESLNDHLLVNLPVANGTYTVRLHFAETIFGGAGNRKFDIVLNDQTVRQNYDIFVAAGGLNKAVVEEFSSITASGGTGLVIDLVNRIGGFPRGPMVSAIEVLRTNAIGTPDPRADIELSSDGGVTWSTIGHQVPVDRFGIGTFNWTIPVSVQPGNDYRVRARTSTTFSGNLQDASDASFLITNGGQHFYINDDSTQGDVFTTSVGSNSNSGKTASQPLSSIAALLAAYQLQPGDVVHVDTGLHRLVNSIVLTSEATGVRFEGPSTGTGVVLDRGNINSPVIELRNADNVTLDHLTIQGGNFGVYANSSSDSDGLTISNSLVQLNDQMGVRLEGNNDQVTIINSTFDGGTGAAIQGYHVVLDGVGSTIKGNSFFRSRTWYAVQANGQGLLLEDNLLQNNRRNITVSNGSTAAADRGLIRNNTLVGLAIVAQAAGIEASGNILVTGNDISNTPLGITGSGEIRGNVVHGNGIGVASGGLIADNRIFNNATIGLLVTNAGQAKNNRVYDNDVGVQTDFGTAVTVSNNFVYNNTTAGFALNGNGYYGGAPTIANNTIIQPTGDAIRVFDGRSNNLLIKNNIIQVASGYAYNIDFDSNRGFKADYNVVYRTGTAKIARWENTDFNDPVDWFYEVGMDEHSQFVDPQFVGLAGLDGRLGYDGADYGADDNFTVLLSSPTIDAGDPSDSFLSETAPNGGRVDIGGQGASTMLPAGRSQAIYMTDVTPLKKYEQGQTIPLDIRSYGVSAVNPSLLINGGSNQVGVWQSAARYSPDGYSTVISQPVDLSNVLNPAPQAVYQSNWNGGVFNVPVPDGTYIVRLHFVETEDLDIAGTYQRKFDIRINGNTLRENYVIRTEAGGLFKAKREEFTGIAATGGSGIKIDLVHKFYYGAILAAIEVVQINPQGAANPTATLELSGDLGATWSTVQNNIPIDHRGYAQTNWTIPLNQPVGTNYQLRLSTLVNGNTISTATRGGFRIANSGPDYFLSPTGDNRNSGKSIDQPMKSLTALIEQYDLDSGDVVDVASGNYRVYRNIALTSQDSGVTILGASGNVPTISRGSTISGTRVISLQGADSVTIDRLGLTGAEIGIDAADGIDSNDVTIRNSAIFGNDYAGINVGTLNDRWTIDSNKLYGLPGGGASDNQQYGLTFGFTFQGVPISSTGHQIVRNEIYDHQLDGIVNVRGGSVVSGNSIHGNRRGVTANTIYDPSGLPLLINSNQIRDNAEYGIYADTSNSPSQIVVSDNEVFGHNGTNDVGIYAYGGTLATGNTVYNNYTGIATHSSNYAPLTRVEQNRVYNNSNAGITGQAYSQVIGNYVYSNALGILALPGFSGQVSSNLLYANTNGGISIQTGTGSEYLNNTIYQSVGDAIRMESSSRDLRLANNLVWVDSGYGIYVAPDSQTNLRSDYNLIYLNGAAARTGFWGSAARQTLASWQTASSQDTNSVDGNPGFVDIDGVDNRLGFAGGVDGGLDDNFYRTNNSPAIDRGNPWTATRADIDGFRRSDDLATPNLGGSEYSVTSIASNFQTTGVAQNFRTDNNVFLWTLPFAFGFYGTSYTSAYVSSNGFLQFGNSDTLFIESNTVATLIQNARIAGLWDDLTTTGIGDDVYLDTGVAGQATVRWNATNKFDSSDVQFSITLFASGKIQFNYGPGNTGLTPTVGISRGNNRHYELVPGYDGSATLTNANTIEFSIIAGYSDIGAYEFRGQSNDTTAPRIILSTPAALQSGGVMAGLVSQLQLTFSEEINPIDARSPAAYELRGAGANSTFNDADDVVYVLAPGYTPGQNRVVLTPRLSTGPLPGGSLPVGLYQVTVLAGTASSIHDLSGNRLDGNGDGTQGDNYVRQFKIINNTAPILSGLNRLTNILRDEPLATNPGTLVSQLLTSQVVDPDGPGLGVAIAAAGSSVGTWQYTLDGVNYQAIEPKLAGGKRLLLAADADTRIRFQPNAGFVGQANELIVSAWDQADELTEGVAVLPSDLSANSIGSQSATATIVVEPRNDAPTDISLSNSTVLENLAAGASVGALSTVDPNNGDTHAYQLVSGAGANDNGLFEIVAGVVKTKSSFDFEAKPSYSIRVRSTDQGGLQVEKAITITIVDLPELIGGPVIGDGTAQRSMIKQIVVTFDREVAIGADAFTVTKRGAGGGTVPSSATGATNAQGQFVVTVTFSGASTHNGALDDGYYQLSIDGTKLTRFGQDLDINQDGDGGDSLVIGDDEADNFFALYGDTNGDGLVGIAEFGQFRSAFGKTSSDAGYNAIFDFESDGAVGISDFGQFRARFGKAKMPF